MANRNLSRWSGGAPASVPRDPFSLFRREMDRLFDDFLTPGEARSFATPGQASGAWPSIDVDEKEDAYKVTAEIPGMKDQEIELCLRDNALILSGEKRSERKEEDGGRRYAERSFGRFERTIPFDAEIDADQVEASCKDGVLTITLPKNAQARDKTRRIEIKREQSEGGRQEQR